MEPQVLLMGPAGLTAQSQLHFHWGGRSPLSIGISSQARSIEGWCAVTYSTGLCYTWTQSFLLWPVSSLWGDLTSSFGGVEPQETLMYLLPTARHRQTWVCIVFAQRGF